MPIITSEKVRLQYILLDTCILAEIYKYSKTKYFRLFEDLGIFLRNANCKAVINEFVRFEFFRGCKTLEHIRQKRYFLQVWSAVTLPVNNQILIDAITIANIYAHKNIHATQVSLVDCHISSYLKNYQNNLVLLTLNHKDFPLLLHDRIGIYLIDTDIEILTFGFYKFNLEKYNKALSDFRKTQISGGGMI